MAKRDKNKTNNKIKRKSSKTPSTKNILRAATTLTILLMIGGICFGFVKLEKFVRYRIFQEDESSVPLKLLDAPDWLNQEIIKRINETAKMGLDKLPVEPATAEMVYRNLDNHLKWLTDISVQATAEAIELKATYRKPIAILRTAGDVYYVDQDLYVLDYITINTLNIVEITGFKNKTRPVPGQLLREDDIEAAIKLIKMLQKMDEGHTKKLVYEIESIDVSNYNRRGSSISQLIIKTIDGPDVLWGAEPGQAAANIEAPEEEKLSSLYNIFRSRGTLKGNYKYIDLRYPKK